MPLDVDRTAVIGRWVDDVAAEVGAKPTRRRAPFAFNLAAMLDKAQAEELVDALVLDDVFACPLCLLELVWQLRDEERPRSQTVAWIAGWVWPEMSESLTAAVVGARMAEVPYAEDALRDLREGGHRSPLAQAVVLRLATELVAAD